MHGYDCKRINYAGLERGPVQMVIEFLDTNYFDAPEDCRKIDRSTNFWLVYSIGITDVGLVDALAQKLGAPTYLLEYSHDTSDAPGGNLEDVSWNSPGESPSSVTFHHPSGTQPTSQFPDRFFWQNGTGIIGLDVAYDGFQMEGGDKAAYGTLAPPMKLADAYPAHASLGAWYTEQSLDGVIFSWSDLECKHPSGS